MQNKLDFGSVLLITAFVILIFSIIYIASTKIINSQTEKQAEASMYSRPSWYEITTTTDLEETESAETDESIEETIDVGEEE